jgi:hypothetical protein
MKLTMCLIACAVCLHATTVNFNDYPNAASNPQGNSVSSGGLAFTSIRNSREGSLFVVGNPIGPPFSDFGVTPVSNGTVFLVASSENNGGVIVTSPGTTFSLSTIDLNKALTQSDAAIATVGAPPNATTINAVGTLLSGGTVVATFRLDGSTNFQTFSFPSAWQDLIAVKFTANNDGSSGASAMANALFAMDNIVFTPGTAFTCNYALYPGGQALSSFGDGGSIAVSTSPGCSWNMSGMPFWISMDGNGNGNGGGIGAGTLNFRAQPNPGAARSGAITVAGLPFTVEQASGLITDNFSSLGSFAQVTSEGTWKFTLNAINLGASAGLGRFQFWDNNGKSLLMPLTFPQTPAATSEGPLLAWTLDRSLNPNAQLVMESAGPDSTPALVGWGWLLTSDKIGGFGILSNQTNHWEAAAPLETRNAPAYILGFDNTGSLSTGVAIAHLNGQQAAAVNVIIRDDTGTQISGATIDLAAFGRTSFMLSDKYAITAGKRGTIEFARPTGGSISVLGLRANGPALTTLPVLANIGSGGNVNATGGGSFTHVTYNGGFTSVFYVINTGTVSGQFTLSFLDESGAPLQVPLSLPQSGTTTTTSALVRTLAAGAMLVVETQTEDALPAVAGSAQLSTTGGLINAFEVFRWTTFGQEASLPLETRNPASFVLVFDHTNDLTTLVALANRMSGSAVDIPVNVRDDAGELLLTTAIHLAAQGHTSFMLPDRYAEAAGKRGMVEFTVPTGGLISVVGLRTKADGTLTTIPALTK